MSKEIKISNANHTKPIICYAFRKKSNAHIAGDLNSNPDLKALVLSLLVRGLTNNIHRWHYIFCMYCCSSSHANVLIRNQLKVHVLQKDRKSNNSLQQSKLITNTLSGPTTEWNESVVYTLHYQHSVLQGDAEVKMDAFELIKSIHFRKWNLWSSFGISERI